MENEQILAGNKLITEFIGGKINNTDFYGNFEGYEYHSSWDWLMKVVEKIENIDIRNNGYDFPKVKFQGDHVEIFAYATYRGTSFYWKKWYSLTGTFNNHVHQVDTKIEAVWLAVVEFLKWYKNN